MVPWYNKRSCQQKNAEICNGVKNSFFHNVIIDYRYSNVVPHQNILSNAKSLTKN